MFTLRGDRPLRDVSHLEPTLLKGSELSLPSTGKHRFAPLLAHRFYSKASIAEAKAVQVVPTLAK